MNNYRKDWDDQMQPSKEIIRDLRMRWKPQLVIFNHVAMRKGLKLKVWRKDEKGCICLCSHTYAHDLYAQILTNMFELTDNIDKFLELVTDEGEITAIYNSLYRE